MGKSKKKSKSGNKANHKPKDKQKKQKPFVPEPADESSSNASSSNMDSDASSANTDESSNTQQSPVGATDSTQELEQCRKRLYALDTNCRAKIDEQAKKFDRIEAEQVNKVRAANADELDQKLRKVQDEFHARLEQRAAELTAKQREDLARLKDEMTNAAEEGAKKRAKLEKELVDRKAEAEADIERYSSKRKAELYEQIKRLKEQCDSDIKLYKERRMEVHGQLIEQIKQKLDLEIKNEKQKGQLKATAKFDKVKEQYQKTQAEELAAIKEAMAREIAKVKDKHEAKLAEQLAAIKHTVQKERDKARARIEDEVREERTKLEQVVGTMEEELKDRLKHEAREIERRKKTKVELLKMLAMPDTVKITDEDFIESRYKYKIERSQIVTQSTASTVYTARKDGGSELYCKVTMFNKWSVRHRADFPKHATRLAHYLTAFREKAPYFVQVVEALATDTKLYTFMEPLPVPAIVLISLLTSRAKQAMGGSRAAEHPVLCTGITKEEFVNLFSQATKAVHFLNFNMFIAHANITLDNITLLTNSSGDISSAKLVLTGLTRPIVYYNVEHDILIPTKGFDIAVDTCDPIDHLPPESFKDQFQAQYLDVYSLGILAFQLVRLRSPFAAISVKKAVATKEAESVLLETGFDQDNMANINRLSALIASLTLPKPRKRISTEEILQHKFFN